MQGYSRSKEDFRELLYSKYNTMEEILGCLGAGESSEDYVLCNGDSELLPKLYKRDEIRHEYNQYANTRSYVSCTIFAAIGMYSDLTNYEFSYAEIKEVDDYSYNNPEFTHIRRKGEGWYVKDAVDCVRKYVNNRKDLVEKYGKVASYRLSKYNDEIIEDAIGKLYTIDGNFCPTTLYNQDKQDGMIDGTDFGTNTNGHSVDVICKSGQRSVKDSCKGRKNNIYGLRNKLSAISNYGPYFYIYTLVEDGAEKDIKRLNEMKTKLVQAISVNSELWHLTNSESYRVKLHNMNQENRLKLEHVNKELAKYN